MNITIQCRRPGRWDVTVDGVRDDNVGRNAYGQPSRAAAIARATELRANAEGAVVTILNRDGDVSYEWRYGTARQGAAPRRGRAQQRRAARTSAAVTGDRKFGVEIEFRSCDGGPAELARRLTERGILTDVEGYNHHVRSYWKIVTDGSCGYELVSPPLAGAVARDLLIVVGDVMRELNTVQGASCGVHVHVETRELNVQIAGRIARSYLNAQPRLNELVAPSRRNQNRGYCKQLSEQFVQRIETSYSVQDVANMDRYHVINFASFPRYGTVEFRQHHATRRGQRVADWVALMVGMVEFAVAGGVVPTNASRAGFVAMVGDNDRVNADAQQRISEVA